MSLKDFNEALFENVVAQKKFEIVSINRDRFTNPVLRVRNSDFRRFDNFRDMCNADSNDLEADFFKVEVENIQLAAPTDDDDDPCNYDYNGVIELVNNRIGVLGKLEIEGGQMVQMVDNFVDLAGRKAIFVLNAKQLKVENNRFNMINQKPLLSFEYDILPVTRCDVPSITASMIKEFKVTENRFEALTKDVVEFTLDNEFDDSFITKTFKVENSTSRQRCDCSEIDKEDNARDKITEMMLTDSKCMSPKDWSLVGMRKDICRGIYPKKVTETEKNEELRSDIAKEWTIYLVIAVIVTFVLTAILAIVATRFLCGGGGGGGQKSRSVSPMA